MFAKRFAQRVLIRGGKSAVIMPAPAFSIGITTGAPAHKRIHLFHREQIGVHSLTFIQPFLLAGVCGKRLTFDIPQPGDVDELGGLNRSPQAIHQIVGHGMA